MTSTLEASPLFGAQVPRVEHGPQGVGSQGAGAVELARRAGIDLFPWQERVLDRSMRVDDDGKWAAPEVALIVSRQNGKGEVLTARCLYGLFVLGENIFHSAHEFKTAADAYRRIKAVIVATPALHRRVVRYNNSHGQEGIELDTGNRLMFIARTAGSGRGFSSIDLLILDEAYNLPDHAMSALLPTQMVSKNSQTLYTSSAVDIDEHPQGYVLSAIRERGLADEPGVYLAEFSAAPELERDDPAAAAQANPSMGRLFPVEKIMSKMRSMATPAMQRAYDVEFLSRGKWPTAGEQEIVYVIDPDVWSDLTDTAPALTDDFAIAVDMPPDRSVCTIGAATRRVDDGVHFEIIFHGSPRDAAQLVRTIVVNQPPRAVVIARTSPAAALVPELVGIDVMLTNDTQMAQACGSIVDEIPEGLISTTGDPLLAEANASASKRDVGSGGAWAWDRRGEFVITPMVAITLARFGLWAEVEEPERDSAYEDSDFIML